jgi:hypothetical protein
MRFLYGVSLLLSIASATEIELTWLLQKQTNSSSLTAYLTDGTSIAEKCGRTIEAKNTIDFSEVDGNGVGNFTVGNASFFIHNKPELSGGPSCSTFSNHLHTLIRCLGVNWDPEGVAKSDGPECFSGHSTELELKSFQMEAQKRKLYPRCKRIITELDGDGQYHHCID